MSSNQSGVTLIELLVVTVIIALLAGIAVPSYRNYIIRTNRTDAKTELLSTAGRLERCFTRFSRYDDPDCGAAEDLADGIVSRDQHYVVTGEVTPTTFLLTATPQGGQAQDTACGALTLNQLDERGPSQECWGR